VIASGGTAGEAAGGVAAESVSNDQLVVVGGLLSANDVFFLFPFGFSRSIYIFALNFPIYHMIAATA
jgi:hypothetical protein